MTEPEALALVLELAEQSVLDDSDAREMPGEAARQRSALAIVRKLAGA